MSTFNLIKNESSEKRIFETLEAKHTFVNGVRTLMLLVVMLFSLAYIFYQKEFINISVWQPVFVTLSLTFFVNSVLYLSDKKVTLIKSTILFSLDVFTLTVLLTVLGIAKPFFIFLLLLDIILFGILHGRYAAVYLALGCVFAFNISAIMTTNEISPTFYVSVLLNDISFLGVAGLSGLLSKQSEEQESAILEKSAEVKTLKGLNQLIVENMGSGIVVVDDAGLITYFNSVAQRIFDGLDLDQSPFSGVLPGVEMYLSHSGNEQVSRAEMIFENARSEKLVLDLVLSNLFDNKGRLSGAIVLITDNTEIKRMQTAMQQKEKLAAVGQLAAGIAHEIRNPLASISGSIQMMEQSQSASEEDARLMRIVNKEIDRLNGLITEFLQFVKPEDIPETPEVISDILNEALEIISINQDLTTGVEIISEFKSKNVIFAHRDKLKQAFLNIIINGLQAMDGRPNPTLEVNSYDKDDYVVVNVKDVGCGMTPENQKRIFEPFHTTKPKGTGLGMAMTHKILESHEARVFIESKVGVGTTFTIEFPVANNPLPNEKLKTIKSA